jgi:hypothetical protein
MILMFMTFICSNFFIMFNIKMKNYENTKSSYISCSFVAVPGVF